MQNSEQNVFSMMVGEAGFKRRKKQINISENIFVSSFIHKMSNPRKNKYSFRFLIKIRLFLVSFPVPNWIVQSSEIHAMIIMRIIKIMKINCQVNLTT